MNQWQIYYAGLCAMTLHPGYQKPDSQMHNFEDCAKMATQMVAVEIQHKHPETPAWFTGVKS